MLTTLHDEAVKRGPRTAPRCSYRPALQPGAIREPDSPDGHGRRRPNCTWTEAGEHGRWTLPGRPCRWRWDLRSERESAPPGVPAEPWTTVNVRCRQSASQRRPTSTTFGVRPVDLHM